MTRKRNAQGRFVKRSEDFDNMDLYEESYWDSVRGGKPFPKTKAQRKPEAPQPEVLFHGSVKTERDHSGGKD